jgi:hypothetical protein
VVAIARAYVPGFVDPHVVDAKDADPQSTEKLVAALRAAGDGKLDPQVFAADAVQDPDGMRELIKRVDKITFVSRRKLKLRWGDGEIAELVTLQLAGKEALAIGLYRDASGKVLLAEPLE